MSNNSKRYNSLLKQIVDNEYSPLKYTVFNFIDNDGYVSEISALNNKKYDIDGFEFMVFDIPEEHRSDIKSGNAVTIQKYRVFKQYVEKDCQKIPNCSVFILKDLGIVICVKVKEYDVKTFEVA